MEGSCPFCEERSKRRSIAAKERMFGLEGTFIYVECASCGSLYLDEPPANLSPYYPDNYYSYAFGQAHSLAAKVEEMSTLLKASGYLRFLRRSGVRLTKETSFIDVGSGSGGLLRALRSLGFPNGNGIDPYLRPDVQTADIPVVRKPIVDVAESSDVRGDVVMFHHSLEHVADPASDLSAARKLLSPNGMILVRIPIVNAAWERFQDKWIGLDAPRHLSIPTEDGFRRLASRVGLAVVRMRYDSTAIQFVASEALERGLTLTQAFPSNPPKTVLRAVRSIPKSLRAGWLNMRRRGDQAAFALRASS
jgi:SAM-dependent methyltransferase